MATVSAFLWDLQLPVAWTICFIYHHDRVSELVVEDPPLTGNRRARVRLSGRVIPQTLQMEPTAVVLGAQHEQWSRENKPVSHDWKKGRGRLDLNQ